MNKTFSEQISFLKVIFLSFISLYSMLPIFLWNKSIILLFFIMVVFFCCFVSFSFNINSVKISTTDYIILLLFLIMYIHIYIINATSSVSVITNLISYFLPTFLFLLSNNSEKEKFLDYFTTLLASILIFSLVFYLMHIYKIHELNYSIYAPEFDSDVTYQNYKFFIIGEDSRAVFFKRFQSFFKEPGHLGMICALILYARKYNFRDWRNIVIFISLIYSLSLAAYVLFFIGMVIYFFAKKTFQQRIKYIFGALILIFILLFCVLSYYNKYPHSVFSEWVISRVLPSEGKSKNNRETSQFKIEYEEFSNNYVDYFVGKGVEKFRLYGFGNASYKGFIYTYGLLGITLLIAFYSSIVLFAFTPEILGFLFLYVLAFYQRTYALWAVEIFVFVSASFCFLEEKNGSKKLLSVI